MTTAASSTAARPRSAVGSLAIVRSWTVAVWGAALAWSVALFASVRSDYENFRLARFDLGNMVQAVWSTAHGRPLEFTDPSTGEQVVRFAYHVDPVLVALTPAWLVAASPLTLAAVQIVACALGALPVYWLGRRHLASTKVAALMSFAYLAYPWLAWTAFDAMHPVTLAIPLLLFAVWALDSGRIWVFGLTCVVVLMTGELMGLAVAALAIWGWLARGHRRAGPAIAAGAIAWVALALAVIVPAARGGASPYYDRYASVGGSPGGILRTAVTDPVAIISELTSSADFSYVLWLAAPLGGLFLLAPWLALVALPQLAVNGLSDWATMTDPRHHYIAAIVPFLVAGAVFGLARCAPARQARIAAVALALALGSTLLLGPWPGPGTRPVGFHATLPADHVAALARAVDVVPEDAPVSTTNTAGSHLAARRILYSVPVVSQADWVLVDSWDSWMPSTTTRREGLHRELLERFLDRIASSPKWRRVFAEDGVFVFQRVAPR